MANRSVRHFVKVAVPYMSSKVLATEIKQIDGPTLYKLQNYTHAELISLLVNDDAEFALVCLYELYAHGEGVKLLKLWEDPIIKIFMEVDNTSFYPLSLYGLMLRTLISYCEQDG